MKTVNLTEDQARNLMQLIDLAVKAGGLNVAAVALPIAQSIEQQLTAPAPESPPAEHPNS